MNDDVKKVPFESFTEVYKILIWAGYCKPYNKPTKPYKRILHQIYRPIAFLIAIMYNAQHIIFTVQVRNDIEKLLDCLVIAVPNFTLIMKIFTVQVHSSRLDNVYKVLRGSVFAATDDQDARILQNNTNLMHRIVKILNYSLSIMAVFWISSFYVKRYFDKNDGVPAYVPFETDTWTKYSFSVLFECGPILWIGYGHLSLDVLVATFYAQAQTQIKMIKHQLEWLVDPDEECDDSNQYKDMTDKSIYDRFVQVVKRFEKLVWYNNEIDTIFNYSLTFQFFTAVSGVCLVIYRMTVVSVTSVPFIFLVLLFFLLLTQIFLYCYYGNLVEFESRSIKDSLYTSDWVTLSPSFRRLMLVAMCRWMQPIRPVVCGIIPLSLNTFVQILKSSYSLYTVLVASKQNQSEDSEL